MGLNQGELWVQARRCLTSEFIWGVLACQQLCATLLLTGHQSRLVFCTIDNEAYPDHMCQHQPRPTHRRSCNTQPCPKTKR